MNWTSRTLTVATLFVSLSCTPPGGGTDGPSATPGATATAAPTATSAAVPTVERRLTAPAGVLAVQLSNGLTVIIKPMHTTPVVCVQSFVKAGSLYEGKWLGCGLSHLCEHLTAEGAEQSMGGQAKENYTAPDRVDKIGGQSNAATGQDSTNYYICAAPSKMKECIELIADWMARAKITPEAFEREHGVVQRELELYLDEPQRVFNEAEMANVYGDHPAAVPIVGYKAPLAAVTRQDVLDYHGRMYVPQNMVFCVVGDVNAEAALDQVRRSFAGSVHGRSPEPVLPEVRPLTSVRRVEITNPAVKDGTESIAFLTIPLLHDDLYALDVLSYVLTQGPASRLMQHVYRKKELVTSISAASWTPAWGKGEFAISFRAPGGKLDAAEKAVLDELKDIVENGVTEDELARAKRQKQADLVAARQTAEAQSEQMATDFLTTGDLDFSANYTDRIQDVTADDVKSVAEKYFTFDAMAITRMTPSAAQAATQPATAPAKGSAGEMFTLPNGLRVVLHPVAGAGLVSMAFAAEGGLLLENEKTNGMGTLMANLSTQGAGKRSAEEIDEFFDSAGGSVSGSCGNNTFNWEATVLQDSFDEALAIFADVVIHPQFPQKELDILRAPLLQDITEADEDLISDVFRRGREKFFTHSPYRMLPAGQANVIQSASAADVAAYHKQNVKAASSVLSIYGSFDAAEAKKRIEKHFAALPPGKVQYVLPAAATVPPGGKLDVIATDKTGAAVMVLAPGIKAGDLKDRFALTVLKVIISGYQLPSGWLHNELRGKQLVYVVHASNWMGLAPGAFLAYAGTLPANAPQVLEIIEKDLDLAAKYTPSQEEIDRAVNTILTADALDHQTMSSLALSTALDELYGLGHDFLHGQETYYRAVKPQDVLRVGQKYLGHGYVAVVTTPVPTAFKAGQSQPATRPTTMPAASK